MKNPLELAYEKFDGAVKARKGTVQKACLALFAYATETSPNRPPLETYLDALLGPVERPGRIDYQLVGSITDKNGTKIITISLSKETAACLNSWLNGTHPNYGTLMDTKEFDFANGSNPAWLSVHFDDDVTFVLEIAKAVDFVGVETFATKKGDMVATTGSPLKRGTIQGVYPLFVSDKPGNEKSIPTHVLQVMSDD